ncbi:MAG: SPOR domain-containing protein [Geminicoccaceae bacterium]
MIEMSMSDAPATGQRGAGTSSSGSSRRSVSILRLSFVSGLNVLSLAFLAYHFAGHPDKAASRPADPPPLDDALMTAALAGESASGNVDLVPASRLVLNIASGIAATESEDQRQSGEQPMTLAAPSTDASSMTAGNNPDRGHWVQVGALSKEPAARRYWSGLKRRNAALLGRQEPRYFSPSEVGGSLYHIRLGPMSTEAASQLCDQLTFKGADCFCLAVGSNQS